VDGSSETVVIKTSVDPAKMAEGYLGHDHWETSKEIIRSVFRPNSRTAVKACHASSKTFTAADCVLIALLLGGDAVTTASTWEQVEAVLWDQVRRAVSDSVIPAREWGQVNQTEITMATGEWAMGISTNEYTRFQGFHARPDSFLLVIVDEAPGVREAIFLAIEGIAAGGDVRLLYLGNPTIPSGRFFDVWQQEPSIWRRYTIDAFDTPNLADISLERLCQMSEEELDDNPRPYLVTRRWVRDRFYEWGVDHPEWQSRVRGEFPQNAAVSLIWRSWIDAQKDTQPRYRRDGGPVVAGIDVAGPGEDETVCYVRQGADLLDAYISTERDARGGVLALLRSWVHYGLTHVNVDSVGIGEGFYQHLRDQLGRHKVSVHDINVGKKADGKQAQEKFKNLKAQCYWSLRERFEQGRICGITDPVLIAQLTSLQYAHLPDGRVESESKDKALKRGVKSPDRAEALMLAYAPELRAHRLAEAMSKQEALVA
jgi:phage terminase large subunit